MRAAAVLAGLMALGGCISTSAQAPPWFSEAQAEADGDFPSLRDVPRTTSANTDPAHWQRVEADLLRAREDLQNHPRAEPAPPPGADEFVERAREILEESRQAHPDD